MRKGDGTGAVAWKKDGVENSAWGGCGSNWPNIPPSEEITHSWDWYLPSNYFGGSSINGGTLFITKNGNQYSTARDGRQVANPGWNPGPIMGVNWWGSGGPENFLAWGTHRVHDLNWCQIQPIAAFEPVVFNAGENGAGPPYYYSTQMGDPFQILVNHFYDRSSYYSTFCHFQIIKQTVTHQIHRLEANVQMDVIKNRLWNEQVWLGTVTGTTFRYQILPQNPSCAAGVTTGDCLSGDQIGAYCIAPYCNQDMTVTNSTDDVITYAQYAGPQDGSLTSNTQGILLLYTINPWREGRHRMRLSIQNPAYPQLQGKQMSQDIVFDIIAHCRYSFVQYNHTFFKNGIIQNMNTPLKIAQYQDLSLGFSHTYFFRWPPNSCTVSFSIEPNSNPLILTLSGTTLKLYTDNPAFQGTYNYVIRAYLREFPANFRTQAITATITAPCNIHDYRSYLKIPSDVRYEMGVVGEMPLEFSFTFLDWPCNVWQNFYFTVKDLTTGLDISKTQKFLRLNFDKFPYGSDGNNSYPRLIVLSHDLRDIGTYQVNLYAYLDMAPIFPSADNIQFTLTIYPDQCVLTVFSDQVLTDQYFKIDFNAPPTELIFLDFQDWVTRDTDHPCGPRKYELSSTGGGPTGMFTSPGAVPSFIGFQLGDPSLLITTTTNPTGKMPGLNTIKIYTENPYAAGFTYTVQIIISLSNWPLFYDIQKLIKTFKVTIDSVCLHGQILYSTFPLLMHKVGWTPPAPSTFMFNPVPDTYSNRYAPNDGYTFCRQRVYTSFRTTCTDCVTAPTPAAVITFPGTTFTLNAATFMFEKQPPQPPILDTTFTVNTNSQLNYRLYWGYYNLFFKVGFLDYPTFTPQEFHFPVHIVPDCQNAVISGIAAIANMRTYINTPLLFSYGLMQHNEYNVYSYYCDNGLSTGGLTYSLLDGSGLPSSQAYLVMTVGATGIRFRLFTNQAALATDVQVPPNPYNFIFRTCLTWVFVPQMSFVKACQYTTQQDCYLPSNCKDLPFTVTLDTDCVISAYNSIDTPRLIETYQVGQAAVTYGMSFQVTQTPPTCLYASHWLVMIDGVDRTASLPTWFTISSGAYTGSIVIQSSSTAHVGKYHIKIYSFLEKIPEYPASIVNQTPTEIIIEILANPCINTRLTSTINNNIFLFTIKYNNPFTDFTLNGYTDTVTVSGEADCGQIIYTITGLTDVNYSNYMTFTARPRENLITFTVFTRDGRIVGDHNFKIHAMLKDFPTLDPMLGIDNYFTIRIASVCPSDVIYRPLGLPTVIKTTIDAAPKVTVFNFVQDSVSTNAGYNDLTEDGGLCGPWAYDIRIGNFYKKSEESQYLYVIQTTQSQGLAAMTAERVLVIDGRSNKQNVGKQQFFVTVTSKIYPTVTNEFEVMAWVYNFCNFNIPLQLPPLWKALFNAVATSDPVKQSFSGWTTPTDSDYAQDWGLSYDDNICGPRILFIRTSQSIAAPNWITYVTNKNATSVGYQSDVVVFTNSTKDIGSYSLQYCVTLQNFINEQCKPFSVVIHDVSYLTSNKPPWFETFMSWNQTNDPDFVYVYKLNQNAMGLIVCSDLETSQGFLDTTLTITSDDEISNNNWGLTTAQNTKAITDMAMGMGDKRIPSPIPIGAGGLFWWTENQDAGKKFTLQMTCSDGKFLIKQKFKCMIEDPNAKPVVKISNETVSATLFEQTVNVTANETTNTTSLMNNTRAQVNFQGRNYTRARPTVYIKSIDCQGTVNLRFSDQMVFDKDIEKDKQRMKELLKVEYLSGFFEDEPGYDKNLNNYSWVVKLALNRDMQIQMNWKAPSWISQGDAFDRIRVSFKEGNAFVSKLGVSIQDDEFPIRLVDYIPPQIGGTGKIPYLMGKSLGSAASVLATSGIAASLFFGFGASQIWGMINGVQLIVFSPALRLKIPANALVFLQNLIQLATFDYLPMDTLFENEFDLPNYESINPWFDSIGLDTRQFILNMGSPWFFLVVALCGVLIYPVLKWFSNKTKLLKGVVVWMRQKLMWSYFIVFMTSMSLEISISSLIQFTSLKWSLKNSEEGAMRMLASEDESSFYGEIISTYSAVIVGGVFIIFNLVNPILLYRNFKNLSHPIVAQPWGAIYEELKHEKWSLCYTNILMLKRIVFAVICFYVTVNGYLQVMLVQLLTIGSIIFLSSVQPFKDRKSQWFMVFNEVITIFFSYSLMVFNDYLDMDKRFTMGWYLCGLMTFYLSFHIFRLSITHSIWLVQYLKNKIYKWQNDRLQAKKELLRITQLRNSNQIEPQIELPDRTPRLKNLKFRNRRNSLNQDDRSLYNDQDNWMDNGQVLGRDEMGKLDRGFQPELNFNPNSGNFNTSTLYIINQPLDKLELKELGQLRDGERKSDVEKLSFVDSLDVDSISQSCQSELSFRAPVIPAGFVVPEMPGEDVWEEEVVIEI